MKVRNKEKEDQIDNLERVDNIKFIDNIYKLNFINKIPNTNTHLICYKVS